MLKREDFTRERMDTIIGEMRRHGPFEALTHEEREKDRRRFLEQLPPGKDLWVFGYGSLLWNPAFNYIEKQPAKLYGFHRRFCLSLTIGRGSPEHPGLMLALDRGGSCNGLAFRIAAGEINSETEILWMRERLNGAYFARHAAMRIRGKAVTGLTFIINRNHSRYVGRLGIEDTVKYLRQGKGLIGTCREYLENTVRQLDNINVQDNYLHRLCQLIRQKDHTAAH